MKKYLGTLLLLLGGVVAVFVGVTISEQQQQERLAEQQKQSAESMEAWCDAMLDKPNTDWSEVEIQRFAGNCIGD